MRVHVQTHTHTHTHVHKHTHMYEQHVHVCTFSLGNGYSKNIKFMWCFVYVMEDNQFILQYIIIMYISLSSYTLTNIDTCHGVPSFPPDQLIKYCLLR